MLQFWFVKSRLTFFLMIAIGFLPLCAYGWGEHGHELAVEASFLITDPASYTNCHITREEMLAHANDADQAWKNQRFAHPDEGRAHFFHVDRQPADWKTRSEAKDNQQGYLVYRIVKWLGEARKLRSEKKWNELVVRLYGLEHYIADLTMPLHLTSDHDGAEAGLPGLHSQFESKMIARYREDLKAMLRNELRKEGVPALWDNIKPKSLIMDTAEQSYKKIERLIEGAQYAYKPEKKSKSKRMIRAQFSKPLLWQHSSALAKEQLALAARLIAWTMHEVCKK